MRRPAILAALVLAATPAAAEGPPVRLRWLGDLSCAAWPHRSDYDDLRKAALTNWVLGYLSRSSLANDVDLLSDVSQAAVSAWLDNFCATHPLDKLTDGAAALEAELLDRERKR